MSTTTDGIIGWYWHRLSYWYYFALHICFSALDWYTFEWRYSSVQPVRGPVARKFTDSTQIYGQHVNLGSAHWSPISFIPHRIGPLLISPPTHWSPNTLLELIGPPSHWSPISLVPHLIGPPFHSSPHHRQIPMVPHLIGPPSHWSPISLVPPLSFVTPSSANPNGPPSHWYPHLIGSPSHWSPSLTLSILFSLVPHLIGPPLVGLIHTPNIGPIHEDFGTLWVN